MRDEVFAPTGLAALYEEDFYVWSQEQAAALCASGEAGLLPRDLDWVRLAEEIADMGKRDLRAAASLTRRILEHLFLLSASQRAEPKAHWAAEILSFRADLRDELTPTIRRLVEARLEEAHVRAAELVARKLELTEGGASGLDPAQRWSVPQILGEADDPLDGL